VDPPNTLGNEGDFYLNTTTGDIFQRDPLSWTQVGNLTGPQGFPGPAGPPGEAGGSDRRDQLAGLLGVDPKRISVPLPAVRPADCSSGGALTLNVNGGPLGQVIGLLGHDAISSPFTFLVAVRAAPGLSRTAFLDANAILSITAAGSSTVRGIVSAFDLAGVDDGNGLYVATVQPTFVRADRTAEFGTFSNSKVSDIVVQVLGSEGISVGVPSTDVQLEYEVRLAETALAFAGRLMEREGLHYHVSDTGSMIVGDGNAVFPGGPELKYLGHFAVSGPGEARLSSFRSGGSIVPEDATVVSWNSFAKQAILADFTFPADDSAFGAGSVLGLALEVETVDEGQSRAAALLGREQVRKSERLGTSNAPGVRAGRNILVTDTVGAGFAGSYVVTEVTHVAIPSQDGACFDYGNAFTAISEDVPFRPPRRTPQPRIGGLISAVVTNTGDPEALARIKVKFPWSSPDNSESRWVRFIQLASLRDPMFPMAPVPPSNFPEIDDEVLVGFIGGDPRRPVALGYLYNGVNRPPEDP
jgi:type VI secretion system secreted protein VgrG